jgi:hypothetical protein
VTSLSLLRHATHSAAGQRARSEGTGTLKEKTNYVNVANVSKSEIVLLLTAANFAMMTLLLPLSVYSVVCN